MSKYSIEGCTKPHVARTLCKMHYERWRMYSDPMFVKNVIEMHGLL